MTDRPSRSAGVKDAAVAIVGGGVMGTSTAYQLARAGVQDVVLLEANELACGSSGKPLGGVRAQFSDPTKHRAGRTQPEGFRAVRGRLRRRHRSPAGRLPVPDPRRD